MEIEIRKVLEASDWDEGGVDPALIEQEHKLREEVGGLQRAAAGAALGTLR